MPEIKDIVPREVRSVNRYIILAGTEKQPEEYAILEYVPLTNCCDNQIKESQNHKREYTVLLPTITQQGVGMGEVAISNAVTLAEAIANLANTMRTHAETMQKILNQAKLALPSSASPAKPTLVRP